MATIERHGVLITPDVARAVLWFFKDPAGIEPNLYMKSLVTALGHADLDNRATLVRAFPELGSAFLAAKRGEMEMLRQVVTARGRRND
jgi:hypothetical protein